MVIVYLGPNNKAVVPCFPLAEEQILQQRENSRCSHVSPPAAACSCSSCRQPVFKGVRRSHTQHVRTGFYCVQCQETGAFPWLRYNVINCLSWTQIRLSRNFFTFFKLCPIWAAFQLSHVTGGVRPVEPRLHSSIRSVSNDQNMSAGRHISMREICN